MKTEHSALVHRLEGIKSQSKQHQMIAQVGKKEDNYTIEVYCVCVICKKFTIFFQGYFACQLNKSEQFLKIFRLSRLCDQRPDCFKGSDELEKDLRWEGEKIIFMYFWTKNTFVFGFKNIFVLGPKNIFVLGCLGPKICRTWVQNDDQL